MLNPKDKGKQYRAWAGVLAGILTVTALHYLTSIEEVASHNIYRRLYYLPIVWAAFAGGLRGGLLAAGLATLAYLPHAFFMKHHMDPAPFVEKVLEMALYFGVGSLTGFLVDRERRAREREAETALAQLEAEGRAERLAGLVHLSRGLAHEIRNPLGGIQGAIEIVADQLSAGGPQKEMVSVALRETGRLGRVVDDFLQFARPRDPEPKPFSPGELVCHVADLCAAEAEAKSIELTCKAGGEGQAYADSEQVTQVLINLVRNALQATPGGGRIVLSAGDSAGSIRFEVADNGTGVPAELGNSIYDPYFTSREGGTGLGLSISAQLVRQNGGVLTHSFNPDGGATFRFDLPRAPGGSHE